MDSVFRLAPLSSTRIYTEQRWAVTRSSPMPVKRCRKRPTPINVAHGPNVRFSDKRHHFHNMTPRARLALLDGPPRLVAEDERRVAIVFSVPKRDGRGGLRPRLESVRELFPLIKELGLSECEPYPLPVNWRKFLGAEDIRVTIGPSNLPEEGRRRSRQTG
jgi:hypothetical protein